MSWRTHTHTRFSSPQHLVMNQLLSIIEWTPEKQTAHKGLETETEQKDGKTLRCVNKNRKLSVSKVVWFRWDFGWCGIIGWEQDKENQQLCRFMSSYTPDSTWRNLGLITRVAFTSSANDLPCSCISCSLHQWDQSELLVRKQKTVAFLSDASWLGNADGQGWNVFLLIKRSRRIRQRYCSAQSIQF